MNGPLAGSRVIELGGRGPGPFATMVLADLGADVIRVDRITTDPSDDMGILNRGKRSIAVDLKSGEGRTIVRHLARDADAFVDPFRPGVANRLGLGPNALLADNPSLVYAQMTGWGQDGPLAGRAGHDINFIALSGALAAIGRAGQPPVPPLNLVGDFGGGGMLLALGITAGLFEAAQSGHGQVVDVSMLDGAALLTTWFHGEIASGRWALSRGMNEIDSGAPHYDVYECADGEYLAVGAQEPKFWRALVDGLGLPASWHEGQFDSLLWPERKATLANLFRSRPRSAWLSQLADIDACVTPVVTMADAPQEPHNKEHGTFAEVHGLMQPAVSPRFSRTPGEVFRHPCRPGEHTDDILLMAGYTPEEITELLRSGAIR